MVFNYCLLVLNFFQYVAVQNKARLKINGKIYSFVGSGNYQFTRDIV